MICIQLSSSAVIYCLYCYSVQLLTIVIAPAAYYCNCTQLPTLVMMYKAACQSSDKQPSATLVVYMQLHSTLAMYNNYAVVTYSCQFRMGVQMHTEEVVYRCLLH